MSRGLLPEEAFKQLFILYSTNCPTFEDTLKISRSEVYSRPHDFKDGKLSSISLRSGTVVREVEKQILDTVLTEGALIREGHFEGKDRARYIEEKLVQYSIKYELARKKKRYTFKDFYELGNKLGRKFGTCAAHLENEVYLRSMHTNRSDVFTGTLHKLWRADLLEYYASIESEDIRLKLKQTYPEYL